MGNCQAAEAATVVIQHPGGSRVDRIYWSVSANEIMNSNPGHYVAQVVSSPAARSESGAPVKQYKLLRPNDTLLIGQIYRLISFEDVLKEFASKKCVKLAKLLNEGGAVNRETRWKQNGSAPVDFSFHQPDLLVQMKQQEMHNVGSRGSGGGATASRGVRRHYGGGGQWRPALQSISELGT